MKVQCGLLWHILDHISLWCTVTCFRTGLGCVWFALDAFKHPLGGVQYGFGMGMSRFKRALGHTRKCQNIAMSHYGDPTFAPPTIAPVMYNTLITQ